MSDKKENKKHFGTIKDTLVDIDEIRFNQEYMDNLLQGLIKESKTEEERVHNQNKLSGGKCFYCKKDYVKKTKKSKLFNYTQFISSCSCYEDRENKKERINIEKMICRYSGIPDQFIDKTFENLDYKKISDDTNKKIDRVKIFIESKVYKKGLGCLFYGDIGVGKTLLAILIFKHLILKENMSGLYIRMSDILKDIVRNNFEFVEKIMKYDVILLDDLDKLKAAKNTTKSGWASERMFSMFDSLANKGKIVISTTNVQDLNELNDFFDSSVVSRLIGNSEVIKMKGNDYRIIDRERKLKNAGLSKNN